MRSDLRSELGSSLRDDLTSDFVFEIGVLAVDGMTRGVFMVRDDGAEDFIDDCGACGTDILIFLDLTVECPVKLPAFFRTGV